MHKLKRDVYSVLNDAGFKHNQRKTVIRGPGTRRIILGMLVDGPAPTLQRAYKENIRLHLHYLSSPAFGPAHHALARKTGVSALYHHVRGLIGWAQQVEPTFGQQALEQFVSVNWPPIQPRRIESDWGD
ncbi:MAG: hypothetical protein CFE32_23390 [Alphaproteobacteria bacterium PA3]|nr:MAG: hypothetical protein CFE32_23390 [Alphaproteobacteria bacterium PA3]